MTEGELLIPTKIIKSKRKSISLQIDSFGSFFVRVPLKANDKTIFDFINKKSNWIIQKRAEILSNMVHPLEIKDDETLQVVGETYSLKLIKGRSKVVGNLIYVNQEKPKVSLVKILKTMTRDYVTKQIENIKLKHDYQVKSISISSAHTNWGSCSYNNALHFSYKLSLCPTFVMDYIIFHELSHTKVKNHSAKFWIEVESVCPNYKQAELWLKLNRAIMNLI